MVDLTPTVSLLELVYTLLAIAGLGVMIYTALDNRLDMVALRRRGINGYAELTASIAIWDSIAAGMFHGLFLVLGVLALTAPTPPSDRQVVSDLFGLAFIAAQAVIVGVQVRNQLARLRIRRKLRRREPTPPFKEAAMSPQLSAALQRALLTAVGAFLTAYVGAVVTTHSPAGALVAGLLAALSALGIRGLGEGLHDARRARRRQVTRADVGWRQ